MSTKETVEIMQAAGFITNTEVSEILGWNYGGKLSASLIRAGLRPMADKSEKLAKHFWKKSDVLKLKEKIDNEKQKATQVSLFNNSMPTSKTFFDLNKIEAKLENIQFSLDTILSLLSDRPSNVTAKD